MCGVAYSCSYVLLLQPHKRPQIYGINGLCVRHRTRASNGLCVRHRTRVSKGLCVRHRTHVSNGLCVRRRTRASNGLRVRRRALVSNGLHGRHHTLVSNGLCARCVGPKGWSWPRVIEQTAEIMVVSLTHANSFLVDGARACVA